MASVINLDGEEIELQNCACGREPEYRTVEGLIHVIMCPSCGSKMGLQRCGMDAVTEWNRPKKSKEPSQ